MARFGDVPMELERALVEAIRAQPEEDAPRLLYAAWLKERGDPRGDFIETQVRWHQAHEALDVAGMKQHGARGWTCYGRSLAGYGAGRSDAPDGVRAESDWQVRRQH